MKQEISINENSCMGCGACTIVAPEIFELNKQNISSVKTGYTEKQEELVLRAAQACPVKAISIKDEQNNQIYPKQ